MKFIICISDAFLHLALLFAIPDTQYISIKNGLNFLNMKKYPIKEHV